MLSLGRPTPRPAGLHRSRPRARHQSTVCDGTRPPLMTPKRPRRDYGHLVGQEALHKNQDLIDNTPSDLPLCSQVTGKTSAQHGAELVTSPNQRVRGSSPWRRTNFTQRISPVNRPSRQRSSSVPESSLQPTNVSAGERANGQVLSGYP
jgi:hypothetical protein